MGYKMCLCVHVCDLCAWALSWKLSISLFILNNFHPSITVKPGPQNCIYTQ